MPSVEFEVLIFPTNVLTTLRCYFRYRVQSLLEMWRLNTDWGLESTE